MGGTRGGGSRDDCEAGRVGVGDAPAGEEEGREWKSRVSYVSIISGRSRLAGGMGFGPEESPGSGLVHLQAEGSRRLVEKVFDMISP